MITKKRGSLLVVLLVMLCLLSPIVGDALTRLPDIGIDYRTMTVNQAAKLTAAGMKDAKNGDKISMRANEEGVRYFKNLRTNEELAYPSAKLKRKNN